MNREQFNDILWKIRQSCKANEIDFKNEYVASEMIQAATKIYLDEISHEIRMVESEETETWQGMHGRNITAPKGTFEKIFNDNDTEDDGV